MSPAERTPITNALEAVIGWCAAISGAITIVAFIFLFTFFAGNPVFGPLNDIAYVLQLLFTLPVVLYMHRRIEHAGRLAWRVTAAGVAGIISAIILQLLLIGGVLPFPVQVSLLMIAVAFIVAWFLGVERLGRGDPGIPQGKLLAVLAGMSIGYPLWVLRFLQDRQTHTSDSVRIKEAS